MANKVADVLEALKVALSTPQAGTVYPPDAVNKVLFWPDETKLDSTLTTLYFIRPGDERGRLGIVSCSVDEVLEVFVLAARRYTEPTLGLIGELARLAVVLDLVGDVKEKLQKDLQLQTEAIDVYHEGMAIDYDRFVANWSVVEMRLGVKYRYEKGARG